MVIIELFIIYKRIHRQCTFIKEFVLVSLVKLVKTMHNLCKVRGSNPGHEKNNSSLSKNLDEVEISGIPVTLDYNVNDVKVIDWIYLNEIKKNQTTHN